MENGSLMEIESIGVLFEWPLKTGFTVCWERGQLIGNVGKKGRLTGTVLKNSG